MGRGLLWVAGHVLASSLLVVCSEPVSLESLSLDQLLQVIARELHTEDGRPGPGHLSFYEFQDFSEQNCEARLVYLMQETLATEGKIQEFQQQTLGVAGIFQHVLPSVPQENTWIWWMAHARRRLLEHVHIYWSKVVALSLDQHQCLPASLRDALLEALVAWRQLQERLLALEWQLFAFASASASKSAEGLLAEAGDWVTALREWCSRLSHALGAALGRLVQHDAEGARAGAGAGAEASSDGQGGAPQGGATRLHHQDEQGSFVTYEFLRRKAFGQWAVDRGLLRGLLRHVWQPTLAAGSAPLDVADFGAGGGHYSRWLNDTGLVQAFAFDGTRQAAELTDGAVQEVNLVAELRLWRNFSWVMCLEVGEHIPKQHAVGLLRNLRSHAREGLIMSWSDDWEGIGHVNCLSRDSFVAMVQEETGFLLDAEATAAVKASCEIDYIARTIAVFRASSS